MKRQSLLIVLIVLCIITMAVGYSIFRTNAEVSGKTSSAKNLEVVFTKIGQIKREGCTKASAVISEDKKTVTINFESLNYNGAYADFPITLKNVGSIPAKLYSINQYGLDDDKVNVSYTGIGITDLVLNPGDEKEFNVRVSWKHDLKDDNSNYKFYIKFNYIQG